MRWVLAALFVLNGLGQVPSAEISNGVVKAVVYLPDAEHGYYRGTRFDWSGVVASLTYQGHEFFGQWFPKYDPFLHDAIMGPVEEFRSEDGALGYAETKPNGIFMKIGVGTLRKPDDKPYFFANKYELVNPGHRVVRAKDDRVEFVHELSDGEGYAYEYTKTLLLPHGKAELVLEHSLKNTGKRTIDTSVYDHDFYMLDHQPTGPDFKVKFPFAAKVDGEFHAPGKVEGQEITYERELAAENDTVHGDISGFGGGVDEDDVRVENAKAGIGVREMSDQPISKVYFWSIRTTVCPEVYIKIHVEPGKTFKWRTMYEFYLVK
jgi:hypothetical protein